MRTLIGCLSVLGLLGALGCDHVAGVCDCDPRTHGCVPCCGHLGSYSPSAGVIPHVAPETVQPELIKEMPMEGAKPMPK